VNAERGKTVESSKRAKVTPEEAIRRTEEFIENGKGSSQEIKTERPKRAVITEEQAIKWTEEFASKRKERFIASVRKSKG